jgi:hypothetical protein
MSASAVDDVAVAPASSSSSSSAARVTRYGLGMLQRAIQQEHHADSTGWCM